ncbi:hypothetical protein QT383_17865 [Stenotrophomonas rhizophila]
MTLIALSGGISSANAQSACTAGACVSAGPRLASIDSTQSPVLNLLFGALLPGTSLNLSVVDWNNLAGANVNLNALLTQLNGGVVVSDPSQVLNTNITLGQLRAAMVQVLQADGQTAAANVLNALPLGVAGTTGSIRLADILQIALPTGSLATVRLNVLDLLTGGVQLYNFRNVLTTPTPITVNTAALGLNGVANVRLWAQVIEPPVYTCGAAGAAFHSAAIRIKLDLDLVQGLNTGTLSAALSGLNLLGVTLSNTSVSADVLHLQVYADVARAEGTISAINLVGNAVTLQARPGLVNLYVGQISDATFFNRSTVLTDSALSAATLTSLSVRVRVSANILGLQTPIADINVPLTVSIRSFATATPGLQSASFTGPYPQTRTLSAGTVSAATMVSTLVNSLSIQVTSGNPTVTLLGDRAAVAGGGPGQRHRQHPAHADPDAGEWAGHARTDGAAGWAGRQRAGPARHPHRPGGLHRGRHHPGLCGDPAVGQGPAADQRYRPFQSVHHLQRQHRRIGQQRGQQRCHCSGDHRARWQLRAG